MPSNSSMNLHTFKDAVASKRASLVHDLDEEEDDEENVKIYHREVEGEEDGGGDAFNEVGEVLEPFNLRNERHQGHFDENMNFVFKKERGELDAWLADMDEAAMERGIGEAAEAARRKLEQRKVSETVVSAIANLSSTAVYAAILKIVKPDETVTRAMNRLSSSTRKTGAGIKRNRRGISTATSSSSNSDDRKKLNELIELADKLLSLGVVDVYDLSYAAVYASTVMWEYRGQDGLVHGPYSAQQIVTWKQQGFFTGASAVQMRPVTINTVASSPALIQSEVLSTSQDLLDDLSDDDGVNATESDGDKAEAFVSPTAASLWRLSDDIDFGAHFAAAEQTDTDNSGGARGRGEDRTGASHEGVQEGGRSRGGARGVRRSGGRVRWAGEASEAGEERNGFLTGHHTVDNDKDDGDDEEDDGEDLMENSLSIGRKDRRVGQHDSDSDEE